VLGGTVTAAVAVMTLVTGGLAAGLGRLAGGTAGKGSGPSLPPAAGPTSAGATPAGPTPAGTASPHHRETAKPGKVPPGTAVGPARDVPVGQAASFTDPGTGDPSIVIRPSSATFVAFDAVCPHAGCTVGYDPSAKVIVCPCHGSQFNASTGAVEVGPAPTGLKKLGIAEGPNGQLYVI
jgi:thiosulfate dehydrogenase [quinone] large subunit